MGSTGWILPLAMMVCRAAMAQDMESFRLRTTGGLVPDDLDLIVDLLELGQVQGLHVYTNLSNLGSGNETALGSHSDNSGLLGLGGEVGRIKMGLLVSTRISETDNPVSIDLDQNGVPDAFGEGRVEGSRVQYLGWENGSYGYRSTRSLHEASFQNGDDSRILFTLNRELGGERYGARLIHWESVQESEISGSDDYSYEDLDLDYVMIDDLSSSRYTYNSSDRYLGLDLGTSREIARGELQLAVALVRQSSEWNDLYRYDDTDLDLNPVGFIEDYRNRFTHEDEHNEESTLGIHARVGLRQTREKAQERRNDSFQELQAVIGLDFGDRKAVDSRLTDAFDADDFQYTHRGTTDRTIEDGDVSRLQLGLSHRVVRALDERVRFAMGVSLHHTSYLAELAGSVTSLIADSTLGSDGILNENDRIQLDRSGTTHEREIRERSTLIALPVGVEYCFSRNFKWTLRLSARYQSLVEQFEETERITGFDPVTREIIDGSGERTVSTYTAIHRNENRETSRVTDTTTFVYGVGYAPTDHLRIDFMGIFGSEDNSILDTSFYRNLRLSVAIRL